MSATDDDDDFDFGEELVYDSELDQTLQAAERGASAVPDIEDAPPRALAPFEEFRRRGFLSVSDLVATVWCEVQFDYRLRTLPYLPISRRPTTITSTKGTSIAVDQVKVEGKERILKRGETIHKRLEREIHPAEVKVKAVSREDAWGLRMLNMFSALEALLTLGKCRELPVAGFVNDVLVLGIIDEIVYEPIAPSPTKGRQTRSKRAESGRQASLNDFFGGKPLPEPRTHRLLVSDSKTRASGSMPREEDTLAGRLQVMLYKELVDALLVPQEATVPSPSVKEVVKAEGGSSEVIAVDADPSQMVVEGGGDGQSLQVIVHSDAPQTIVEGPASPSQTDTSPEAYLPTSSPSGSGLWRVWDYLGLDTHAPFSDEFVVQSRPVVDGNLLRFGVSEGRTLADFAACWVRYVAALGLGAGPGEGRTDDALELVYRRAAPKRDKGAGKRRKAGKSKRRRRIKDGEGTLADVPSVPTMDGIDLGSIDVAQLDEETQLQIALQLSLQGPGSQTGEETALGAPLRTETSHAGRLEGSQDPFLVSAPSGDEPSPLPPITTALPRSAPPQSTVEADPPSQQKSPEGPEESQLELVSETASASGAENRGPAVRSQSTLGSGTHARPTPSFTQRSVSSATKYFTSDSEQEREDAELAWAVEMSLGGVADEPDASGVGVMSPPKTREKPRKPSPARGSASGSVIGRHRFTHDRAALAAHLRSVLEYWRGTREPRGVDEANVRRCEWCEFEEGCEWREDKAQEALARYRNRGR